MRNYVYVFIGGAAGGLMRAMAVRAEDPFSFGGMDNTIFLINIAGAFLLGMFLSGTAMLQAMGPGVHLGIAVGFFGSFTTFSTLTMEAVGLLQTGSFVQMASYVVFSCMAGLLAAGLGFWTGSGKYRQRFNWFPIKTAERGLTGNKPIQAAVPVTADEMEED